MTWAAIFDRIYCVKTLIRNSAINAFGLFIIPHIFNGIVIQGGIASSIIGGFVLAIMSFTIKPILSIITLPLNIITFGAFSFVINGIILYLLTVFVPAIIVRPFVFGNYNFAGFVIPPIHLNLFFSYIVIALGFSIIVTCIQWILD